MKTQKILKVAILAVLLLIMLTEGFLLYYMHTSKNQNVITVGNVNVSLVEPKYEAQRKNGQTSASPGDKIMRDPVLVIEEGSELTYLRTTIVTEGLSAKQRRELLQGLETEYGWNYNAEEDFYYYNEPVTVGAQIAFFSEVTIPEEWSDTDEKIKFRLDVYAQAVQASYLTPRIDTKCQIIGWTSLTDLVQAKSDY